MIPIRPHELVPEVLAGVGSIIVQKHEFDKLTGGKEIHCYALTILAGHVVEVGHRQIHGVYEVTFSHKGLVGQAHRSPRPETDRIRPIRDCRAAVTHGCGELDGVAVPRIYGRAVCRNQRARHDHRPRYLCCVTGAIDHSIGDDVGTGGLCIKTGGVNNDIARDIAVVTIDSSYAGIYVGFAWRYRYLCITDQGDDRWGEVIPHGYRPYHLQGRITTGIGRVVGHSVGTVD